MKKLLWRLALAALLIFAVALKMHAPANSTFDVRAAATDVLVRAGAKVREPPPGVEKRELARATYFEFPGCEAPIEVIPVTLSLQERALFAAAVTEGYKRRFVYMDKTWLTEDRLGMRIEWLKAKLRWALGMGPAVTAPKALLIAEPPHCHVAETIDWPAVWSR